MVSGFLKTGFDSFRNLKGSSIKYFEQRNLVTVSGDA